MKIPSRVIILPYLGIKSKFLFNKFSNYDTSTVVDRQVSTSVNVNLLLYDSTSVVNNKITNTIASYLSVCDNTTTSNSKLSLKADISDVNSTFTSVMNSMDWFDTNWDVNNKINNTVSSYLSVYDNTITSNSKLAGKLNIIDGSATFTSLLNKFSNYDISSVVGQKIYTVSKLSFYDTTITSNNKLSLKANIVDVNNTCTTLFNNFSNYDTSSVVNNKINTSITSYLNNYNVNLSGYDSSLTVNSKLSNYYTMTSGNSKLSTGILGWSTS